MTEHSSKKTIIIESEEDVTHQADETEPVDNGNPPDPPSNGAGKDVESLKDQLESAQKTADEAHDRLLRLSAEFDNYKKRMNRQMDEFRKYANESLLKDLLPVVDNLERALNLAEEKAGEQMPESFIEGVEMTLNEILKILSRYHVTPIEAKGKPFDPVFHEAVMQEPSDDQPENTVINEFQKGYLIHDRLLRPSMVVVSKK